MRLLLLLILSSLFLIAPNESSAGDVSKHTLTAKGKQFPKASLISDVASIDLAAVIRSSGSINNTGYQFFSFTNFINTVCFTSNTFIPFDKKYFVDPYAYHQPIALKLLFPEHYFW